MVEWAWSEPALSWDVVTEVLQLFHKQTLTNPVLKPEEGGKQVLQGVFFFALLLPVSKEPPKKQFLSPWSPPLLPGGKQTLSRFDPCASSKKMQQISHFCSCVLRHLPLLFMAKESWNAPGHRSGLLCAVEGSSHVP